MDTQTQIDSLKQQLSDFKSKQILAGSAMQLHFMTEPKTFTVSSSSGNGSTFYNSNGTFTITAANQTEFLYVVYQDVNGKAKTSGGTWSVSGTTITIKWSLGFGSTNPGSTYVGNFVVVEKY